MCVTLASVVSLIENPAGQPLLTSISDARVQDILVSVLNPSLSATPLGFRASFSLEQGPRKFLSLHNIPVLESR